MLAAPLLAAFLLADSPTAAPAETIPPVTPPLEALRASFLPLETAWRFRLDPDDRGETEGWADPALDDSGWETIDAGRSWESQGHEGYDGVAWYRRSVDVPADWADSPVRFVSGGIDDEYDLYVNGVRVAHRGSRPDRSVWNAQTEARLEAHLRFGEPNLIAIRVVDWGYDGGIVKRVHLRRDLPIEPYLGLLPEPVLDANPDWIALYREAWRMAWEKVSFGTDRNGLVEAYMDEGFNEQIYQWDSVFITLFARYGARLFPVLPTLENFYRKQRPDGYIQRCYSETDGGEVAEPTDDDPMVNPPLFAWAEWEHYRFGGDRDRLARVLPALERYHLWLERNLRKPAGGGLFYQSDLGSGMDNAPRADAKGAAWVDMSCQMALDALSLARIAETVGDAEKAERWRTRHREIADLVNALLWDEETGFYHDLGASGLPTGVRHIGAYWSLLSGVADDRRARLLVRTLSDPSAFWRPHPFPSLAASEPLYRPDGHYWRGGVWAPTNYMVLKGLRARGYDALAREAAERHLSMMSAVFADPPGEERVAAEERGGDLRTIWECYAPEAASPATRWDGRWLSRRDFVGWGGLGPTAILLEGVSGLETIGSERRIVWRLSRADRHGVLRLPLADGTVSLVAGTATPGAGRRISVETDLAFTLEVRRDGRPPAVFAIAPGSVEVEVGP